MSAPTLRVVKSTFAQRLQALKEAPATLTVAELIDRYMAQYTGRSRSAVYHLSAWRELLGELTLQAVDTDVIRLARDDLATLPALTYKGRDAEGSGILKGKSGAATKCGGTINRYMSSLSAVFTWAMEERLTPRGYLHPCRGIRRLPESPGRVRFLDDDERDRLLEACRLHAPRDGKGRAAIGARYPRLYALVLTAMLTGARKGELLGLTWGDVDLDAKPFGLARVARTKNGDARTLVLLPQVVAVLRPFAMKDATRVVFGSVASRYTRPASIDTAWDKALKRSGVENFVFHDLRHCCASYLVQAGVDLAVVADVLGHRKLDMTRRYAHMRTETKARAMAAALGSIGLDTLAA